MDILILIGGWSLSAFTIYAILSLIKGKRHGGTVSAVSFPALVVALGFFCISTPKVNKLVLDWGAKKLDVSKLEKQIKDKEEYLAKLDLQIPHGGDVAPAGIAEKGPSGVYAEKAYDDGFDRSNKYVIPLKRVKEWLPEVKLEDGWNRVLVIEKSEILNRQTAADKEVKGLVVDQKTGNTTALKFNPSDSKVLVQKIKKGNQE